MTILFFFFVSLGLLIIKTSLIAVTPFSDNFYDLLIPIIISLSFFRSIWEGLPIVLLLGFVMDSLGGGPMGLYMITYLWLYAAMLWLSRYLYTGSILVLAVAVALGVAFESAVLVLCMVFLSPTPGVPRDAAQTITLQLIWAIVTGPFLVVGIGWGLKRLDRWRKKLLADQ